MWHEIDVNGLGIGFDSRERAKDSGKKWFPYNKGGEYRKWFGNNDYVVNWAEDGKELRQYQGSFLRGEKFYFKAGLTWSKVSSGILSFRLFDEGFLFDTGGLCAFSDNIEYIAAILNSKVSLDIMSILAPTLNFTVGTVSSLPIVEGIPRLTENANRLKSLSKSDWDSYETSWDFTKHPLLSHTSLLIKDSYSRLLLENSQSLKEYREIEEYNNKVIAEAYGITSDALTIADHEITLFSSFGYRYGPDRAVNGEFLYRSDVVAELISYSIGAMLGRYSIDSKGVVYAHTANEGFEQLVAEGAYKTFPADEDGIIPLTDQEWFKDDATKRFREFVQVVWGDDHLQENLDFVAESLCLNAIKPKKSESALETIRRYLSTQFYKDHLKTYKKRPIYWLFSSGKQKAFECLVYLHRYNEGTLSRMRTEYVTPLLGKYDAYAEQLEKQIETADSTSEANRFKKELDALIKKQVELREFDDKLKHYADMRISLDLDDGVKVNYGKFGDLLADVKAITGSAPEVN